MDDAALIAGDALPPHAPVNRPLSSELATLEDEMHLRPYEGHGREARYCAGNSDSCENDHGNVGGAPGLSKGRMHISLVDYLLNQVLDRDLTVA